MDDMIGKKFGKWTVLSKNEEESNKRRPAGHTTRTYSYYNCVCDCGNLDIIARHTLKANSSTQCKSCAIKQRADKHRGKPWKSYVTDHDSYLKKMKEIHPNITVVGIYTKSYEKVELHCNICNTNYFQQPKKSINDKRGCPQCKANNVFKANILDSNGAVKESWCSDCKKYCSVDRFSKNKATRSGYDTTCYDCKKIRRKKSLVSKFRTVISTAMKGYKEGSKTHEILGISFEELTQYITTQFDVGMSIENQNLWVIDHIIPISHFERKAKKGKRSIRNALIKGNHYSNLQPLWFDENANKSDKLNWDRERYRGQIREAIKSGSLTEIPPWYYIELNGSLEGYE